MTEVSTDATGTSVTPHAPGAGPPGGSDAELWHAIAGDGPRAHAAFTELFQRHAEAVWNYAYRLTASWAQADDLLSTVFLNAWRTRGRAVPARDSARPWLFTVAARLARDERRAGVRLPLSEREVVRLCLLGEVSTADAARLFGIVEAGVRAHLSRARLRELLEEDSDD